MKPNKSRNTSSSLDHVCLIVEYLTARGDPSLLDMDILPERQIIIPSAFFIFINDDLESKTESTVNKEHARELLNNIDRVTMNAPQYRILTNAIEYITKNLRLIIDYGSYQRDYPHIKAQTIRYAIAMYDHWSNQSAMTNVKILSNTPGIYLATSSRSRDCVIRHNPATYTGWIDLTDCADACTHWKEHRSMSAKTFEKFSGIRPKPHLFAIFTKDIKDFGMIGRFDSKKRAFVPLAHYMGYGKLGITPRNIFQAMAIEACHTSLASIIIAPPGRGKTSLIEMIGVAETGILTYFEEPKHNQTKQQRHGGSGKSNNRQVAPNIGTITLIPSERMTAEHSGIPGNNEARYSSLIRQFKDHVVRLLENSGHTTSNNIRKLKQQIAEQIDVVPLSEVVERRLRGHVYVYEAQHLSFEQLKAIIDRADDDAHIYFIATPECKLDQYEPFSRICRILSTNKYVAIVRFPESHDLIISNGAKAMAPLS